LVPEKEEPVEKHTVVGVDVAKVVVEIAISEEVGRVARGRRVPRSERRIFFARLPKATVMREA
jgi:hypothetical protein